MQPVTHAERIAKRHARTVAVKRPVPARAGGPDPAKRSEGGETLQAEHGAASERPPLAIEDGGPPASGGTGHRQDRPNPFADFMGCAP